MPRVAAVLVFLLVVCSVCLASASPVEVLYVETHGYPPEQPDLLYTYNVNPETAVAAQVASPLPVPTTSIDPLTVAGKHILYLWNGTDVWKYNTNAQGAPEPTASQHSKFGFPYPVFSFLADPNGKFAYAVMRWADQQGNNYDGLRLFTIDQTTGDLTDTDKTGPLTGLILIFGSTAIPLVTRVGRCSPGGRKARHLRSASATTITV
jgi:hypothetical protein